MKTLRRAIQRIIMESASIVDTEVVETIKFKDLIFVVDLMEGMAGDIYLCQKDDFDQDFGDVTNWKGKIEVSWIGKKTLEVSESRLDKNLQRQGIGALLYNVTLSMCTKNGNWLMPDRETVSDKAERIWDTWQHMENQYEIQQTDHEQPDVTFGATLFNDYDPKTDYFLTKTRGDDFHQGSFQNKSANWEYYSDDDPRAQLGGDMVKDWWWFFSPEYKDDFLQSGLTKRYKMKNAQEFIDKLKGENLLYVIGEPA